MSRTALFVRWILGIVAAAFLLLGVGFMFIPSNMIGAMDITAEPGKALADIRAVYGGLDLAVGILLSICFFRREFSTGLAICALVLVCLFSGRLIGIVWDPARDVLTLGLFAIEVLFAVLSAVAWFLARQPEPVVASAAAAPTPAEPAEATNATPTTPSEPNA